MSQDYPDLLRFRQRHPFLAVLWRIGDAGYYIGLFGAIIGPLAFLGTAWLDYTRGSSPFGLPQVLLRAALFFLGCVILGVLSLALREYARRRGSRMER